MKQVTNSMIACSDMRVVVKALFVLVISKGVSHTNAVCYYENIFLPHLEGSQEELITIDTQKEES